jgi:VanZ family protein
MQNLPTTGRASALLPAARIAFVVAAGAILYLALSKSDGTGAPPPWDKIKHFFAFYVLTCLALVAAPGWRPLAITVSLLGFGVAIEILQLIPALERTSSLDDIGADALGIAAALAPLAAARLRRALAARA